MKITIIVLLFIIPFELAAQKLSIELNFGSSLYSNKVNNLNKLGQFNGEQGGVNEKNAELIYNLLVGYKLNSKLHLKAGIGYQLRQFNTINLPNVFGTTNSFSSTEMFVIPLRIQYQLAEQKRFNFFVQAGITPRINLEGSRPFYGFSMGDPKQTEQLTQLQSQSNMFLNGRNESGAFNGDSAVLVLSNYYQYNKLDVFANFGIGSIFKLSKHFSLQVLADYNFQINKSNYFGKYRYEEIYRNGTLVGKFEEQVKSNKFRDNFFTVQAGLLYIY